MAPTGFQPSGSSVRQTMPVPAATINMLRLRAVCGRIVFHLAGITALAPAATVANSLQFGLQDVISGLSGVPELHPWIGQASHAGRLCFRRRLNAFSQHERGACVLASAPHDPIDGCVPVLEAHILPVR